MCGIAGIFFNDPRRTPEPDALEQMIGTLAHRGPDDSGSYVGPGVAIGMRRLSIIDIAGGKQPVTNEDGSIVVVQNGEIYNYRELRASLAGRHQFRSLSDTEVIAHAYEEWGSDFVRALNGMFAIALFDARSRTLVLARDRLGKKPLYIYRDAEKLLFASEIKALLASGAVAPRIDPLALDEALTFNFVPLPRTAIRDVRHLEPATTMTVGGGRTSETRYWRLAPSGPPLRPEAAARALGDLLADAVDLRLRADVPVGLYLSGGLDSSGIAALVARRAQREVVAFGIGFDREGFDETVDAEVVARHLRLPFRRIESRSSILADLTTVQWYCDQPHGDASFMPMLQLARAAHEEVKVVLTGEGADELFGGYSWHPKAPYVKTMTASELHSHTEEHAVFRAPEKASLYTGSMGSTVGHHDATGVIRRAVDDAPDLDPINQSLFVDLTVLLPGNNLVKADRTGMATGLEIRCPYLDYRIVELAFQIPGREKIRDGILKRPLREFVAGLVPSAASRPKRMFAVPMGDWFRSDNGRTVLQRLIDQPSAVVSSAFDPHSVEALVRDHQVGRDNTRKLRILVAINEWSGAYPALNLAV